MYTSAFYLQTKYHLINFFDFLIYSMQSELFYVNLLLKFTINITYMILTNNQIHKIINSRKTTKNHYFKTI